jgi:hypothetical protein
MLTDRWSKSSRSFENGACVEARHLAGQVDVRDSKELDGPILQFSPDAWRSFVAQVTTGSQKPA